jgi:hypothetical protein
MIQLPCREAARFRAMARRCVVGRPRGPAPPVRLLRCRNRLMLSATFGELTLTLRLAVGPTVGAADGEGEGGAAEVAEFDQTIPFAVLEAAEGTGSDIATIDFDSCGTIRCRTMRQGRIRETTFEEPVSAEPPASLAVPAPPSRMRPAGAGLLAALDECGRTTSAQASRFALARVQLRGKEGEIVGTDGRQLLVWNGFELPFAESLLIPAVPVFGSREFASESEVRIGRAGPQVVVEAGNWTVFLTIAEESRYPDVTGLLARTTSKSRLSLSARDADAVLQTIRRGHDRSDKMPSVTVRLSSKPQIVVGGSPLALAQSEFSGSAATVSILAHHLSRALRLGLRTLGVEAQQCTVLFADERRSYLVTCSQPDPNETPESADSIVPASSALSVPVSFVSKGESVMPSSKNNQGRSDDQSLQDAEATDEAVDPLAEAEGLRAALTEAGRRTGRLIASLRQIHKQRRVFQTVASRYLSRNG